jgi:hypothetical protein
MTAPAWRGEPLAGRRLLVWAEQGLGDTLQFVRYARHLADLSAEIVVEVQPELERVVRQSLPDIEVIARGGPPPRFDVHAPLMSLPHRLGTHLDTIPADVPYLKADEARMARWADRLGPRDAGRRIGVVWAGNVQSSNLRRRSLDPGLLGALADVPGVEWFSLQKGSAARPPVDMTDWTAELLDFADTAALLTQLDLVITVDTAVAHLAGALGRPVWIMLLNAPDWRWLLRRADSPWYPTARLFRQHQPGDWNSVVQTIAQELQA